MTALSAAFGISTSWFKAYPSETALAVHIGQSLCDVGSEGRSVMALEGVFVDAYILAVLATMEIIPGEMVSTLLLQPVKSNPWQWSSHQHCRIKKLWSELLEMKNI